MCGGIETTLIIADRWRGGDRSKGSSDIHYLWRDAARHFQKVVRFHPDIGPASQGGVDVRLLRLVGRKLPKRILLCPTFVNEKIANYFPSLILLDYLVTEKGCSLILVSPDWASGQMRDYAVDSLGHLLLCNLVLDLPNISSTLPRHPPSVGLWAPADETRFYPGNDPREIDLLFVGTLNEKRRRLVKALEGIAGYRVMIRDREKGRPIQPGEYGRLVRHTKIVLNQSSAYGLEQDQMKGRVVEAMAAGCCLLDDSEKQTPFCFLPGRDYVKYGQPDEVPGQVVELLKTGRWREIGQHGHQTYREQFSSNIFWKRVIAEIETFENSSLNPRPTRVRQVPPLRLGLAAIFRPGDPGLERWAEHLLASGLQPKEVICTSDFFSDKDRTILQRIPGIRVLERPAAGEWEAILHALRASTADHLLVSSSQVRYLPDASRKIREVVSRWSDADVLIGQIWDCDEHGERRCLVKPDPARDRFDLLAGKVMLPLAASVFRRAALVSVGLHRTDWRMDCGDYELWIRLLARNRIRTIPVCLAEYPSRKDSLSLRAENRARESRGRLQYALMNLYKAPFRALDFQGKSNLLCLLVKRALLDRLQAWQVPTSAESSKA